MGNFNMLPEDIILNILTRLPAETVMECKLVSQPWRNLVRDPSFSQMHFNHLDSGKLGFLLYTAGFEIEPVYYTEYDENSNRFSKAREINLRPPFDDCYILGSINGLICFSGRRDNMYLHYEPGYVCNPITREYIVLPKLERSGVLTGFGYSPSTNEYKVVRVCNSRGDSDSGVVQVYTLGSRNGWRNVRKLDSDLLCGRQYGVSVNGAIYWVGSKGSIISFDLADEEFQIIPSIGLGIPAVRLYVYGDFVRLHACGDFVSAFIYYGGAYDIWVLKKNGNDVIWSEEFSFIKANPISFTKSGGLLCRDQLDNKVYCYALEDSAPRILVNFDKDFKFNFEVPHKNTLVSLNEVPHKNTLVSLKALGEEDTKLMDSGARARSCKEAESSGQ